MAKKAQNLIFCDRETQKWFERNIFAESTLMRCPKCGLYYKPELGHKCTKDAVKSNG